MKKVLLVLFALLLGLGLFWHALKDVNFSEVYDTVRDTPWYAMFTLFVLTVFGFYLTSYRWLPFIQHHEKIDKTHLTLHSIASFMMSYLTPATLLGGEPVKIYLLKNRDHVGLKNASSSVILDKIVELVTVAVFIFIALLLALQKALSIHHGKLLAIGFLALFLLCILISLIYRKNISILEKVFGKKDTPADAKPSFVQRLIHLEQEIMLYFSEHRKSLFTAIGFAILIWLLKYFELSLFLYTLGIHLTLKQSFMVVFLPLLSWILPIPAGLGVMESSTVLLFQAFGQDPSAAISYVLLLRFRDLCFVAVGLWHTFHPGFRKVLASLWSRNKKQPLEP